MATSLRIFGTLCLLIIGVIAAIQLPCGSWPKVEGKVIQGNWANEGTRSIIRQRGVYEVRYSYTVNLDTYESTRLSFHMGGKSVMPILNAESEIRQPREGDKVHVFYNPIYPAMSVLINEPSPTLHIWAIICVLVAAACFGFARVVTHPLY
jgi:hypothetical protein